MKIILHKSFSKKYKKLRKNEKNKFKERRNLFLEDPLRPILNNHALHGKYAGYNSINITGNLRAVFKFLSNNIAIFVDIDTHNNLYS